MEGETQFAQVSTHLRMCYQQNPRSLWYGCWIWSRPCSDLFAVGVALTSAGGTACADPLGWNDGCAFPGGHITDVASVADGNGTEHSDGVPRFLIPMMDHTGRNLKKDNRVSITFSEMALGDSRLHGREQRQMIFGSVAFRPTNRLVGTWEALSTEYTKH